MVLFESCALRWLNSPVLKWSQAPELAMELDGKKIVKN
jgi:hypothetical protein